VKAVANRLEACLLQPSAAALLQHFGAAVRTPAASAQLTPPVRARSHHIPQVHQVTGDGQKSRPRALTQRLTVKGIQAAQPAEANAAWWSAPRTVPDPRSPSASGWS